MAKTEITVTVKTAHSTNTYLLDDDAEGSITSMELDTVTGKVATDTTAQEDRRKVTVIKLEGLGTSVKVTAPDTAPEAVHDGSAFGEALSNVISTLITLEERLNPTTDEKRIA